MIQTRAQTTIQQANLWSNNTHVLPLPASVFLLPRAANFTVQPAVVTGDESSVLVTTGSYPTRAGNAAVLLIDGEPAFRRICEAIEAARRSVWEIGRAHV